MAGYKLTDPIRGPIAEMTPSWIQSEPPSAEERIAMIRGSLQAWGFAMAGLVPIIGFPFALVAIVLAFRSSARGHDCWNAAGHYRLAALWISGVVLVLEGCAITVAILAAMND